MAEEIAAEAAPNLNTYLDEKSADILDEVAQEAAEEDVSAGSLLAESEPEGEAQEAPVQRKEPGPSNESAKMAEYLDNLSKSDPAAAAEVLRQLASTYDNVAGSSGATPNAPAEQQDLKSWLGQDPEDLDSVTRAMAESVLNQHNFLTNLGQRFQGLEQQIVQGRTQSEQEKAMEGELDRVQTKYGLTDSDMDVVVQGMEDNGMDSVEGAAAVLILDALQKDGGKARSTAAPKPSAPPPAAQPAPNQIQQMGGQQSMIPSQSAPANAEFSMEDAFREAARAQQKQGRL